MEQIGSLTERIRDYERQLERISKKRYPQTDLLRQVEGIGPLTALTFVLTLPGYPSGYPGLYVWLPRWRATY